MRRGEPAILAFAARINGVDYPAAMFKLSRRGACVWTWQYSSNGTLIIFDPLSLVNKGMRLSEGNIFLNVTEDHFRYPSDGRYHQTIEASGRDTARLHTHRGVPLTKIQAWTNIRSVDVPLIGPFWSNMNAGAWRAVQRPVILRSEDFDGADGVELHAFICRRDRVDDLIQRWRVATRHWIASDQDLQLVVLAAPVGTTLNAQARKAVIAGQ